MGKGSSGKGMVFGGSIATITEKNLNKLIDMGARRWTKGGKDRLYLGGIGEEAVGLKIESYKSGSIKYAEVDGETISNSLAGKILTMFDGAYINLEDGGIAGIRSGHSTEVYKEKFINFINKYRKIKGTGIS